MNEELNKKLAEWAGFSYQEEDKNHYRGWTYTDDTRQTKRYIGELNFTESLDACFKWLMPKLDVREIYLQEDEDGWQCDIYYGEYWAIAETPALALCKAIEQLIDRGE